MSIITNLYSLLLICDSNYQVAGGDGTASWLLGVVSDMRLPHPPKIATVPLGTGNNLHFSFGWVSFSFVTPVLLIFFLAIYMDNGVYTHII